MTEQSLPPLDLSQEFVEAATKSKAWPFEEARKLVKRIEKKGSDKPVLFETGYGPSGLPHIGTFGEVLRTTMVRTAFRLLTEDKIPTRLLCFSDDMDGMRKIPENVPDRAALEPYLQMPLTAVPNPFGGDFDSFAAHNNAMLRRFLDTFGFDYEFASATEYYKAGKFDDVLIPGDREVPEDHGRDAATLGAERQATIAVLPISPTSGRVLYVPMKDVNPKDGTITFADETGEEITVPVTGGKVKLQWKPDFGMRWAALDVDFEMFGKDHMTNAPIYDKICNILGGTAPEHFVYELFLDEKGEKISKSKGNGLTIDEWLTYAAPESLALYNFQKPKTAKKLYFDVIPKAVDEYYTFVQKYEQMPVEQKLQNPAWHIHSGNIPKIDMPVPFAMLLNLVSASNAENKDVLWAFISRYAPGVTASTHPELDALVGYAIRYFDDFVKPAKSFKVPDDVERTALEKLDETLAALPADADGAAIQDAVLDVARSIERYQDPSKKGPDGGPGVSVAWFSALYQLLLGQEKGPRFGSFVALYGIAETREMIRKALAGELTA
ncbi:lysyl-tRNA synthetase [Roseibium aggregatum IAM 12614]|uniref:Lysine--tRNA ligase n=1 Tax=Roseibium aggregatum (strain ATCC 25650 / DSM 13394 / JCM 20685 / NBRC 16684 / NCIMB 2208 / IAM 12614 / B1) TaxID=384765 RepID=A0NR89_ROSAI|nr:lysine--tRNA ligase [Roseibium aggregatum]EAV44670.1 lysyl-tRNA synthetase [Roseibium aggregatum IAM 12614]